MICSKILVAYDESDLAGKALAKAIEIAKTDPEIEIQVLHIISVPVIIGVDQFVNQSITDKFQEHGRQVLAKAAEEMKSIKNEHYTFLADGKSPATLILNHAKKNSCDLIIMGSRGLSGIKEMLGSVSHTVTQQATVPVLIVK